MIGSELLRKILTYPNNLKILQRISNSLTKLTIGVNDKIRKLDANNKKLPRINSFDGQDVLLHCVREKKALWSNINFPHCDTPGMITDEECQYYCYMGKYFTGIGEVVELGPWLGKSTFFILFRGFLIILILIVKNYMCMMILFGVRIGWMRVFPKMNGLRIMQTLNFSLINMQGG